MLGNVWEWCLDDMRDYQDTAETDPAGSMESQSRALRGGSWLSVARIVRAASRDQSGRGDGDDSFGFRCARVRGGAEPIGLGRGEAERTSETERIGGAVEFSTQDVPGVKQAQILSTPSFIRSDSEKREYSKISKPDWANAIGRDQYGIWTELAVDNTKTTPSLDCSWFI